MRHDRPQGITTSPTSYLKNATSIKNQSLLLLKKLKPFVEAIETDVGQAILNDLVNMHAKALEKIASLESTDHDKIEYKILTDLIQKWSSYIITYENSQEVIQTE